MSENEKRFLARWSQRKREAGKAEPEAVAPDENPQPAERAPEAAAGEAEPPFDLERLPKLEEITARTDMTVFFKKGVPERIRNAALRKAWALDPAIRDYVNPALDYAYDWNAPGGVPGSGELAPGTDVARMVSQIMGEGEPRRPRATVDKTTPAETDVRDQSSDRVAERQTDTAQPGASVRLSEAPSPAIRGEGESIQQGDPAPTQPEPNDLPRDFASQQEVRRHGSARPK